MPGELHVSDLRFEPAKEGDISTGLLGYVSLTVGESLRLDGLTLRRTLSGRLTLSFPSRTARTGKTHPYIRPVDDAARRAFEAQVLSMLGLLEARAA